MNQIQHKQPGSDPVRKRKQHLGSHSVVVYNPGHHNPSVKGDNASLNHAKAACNGGDKIPGPKYRVLSAVHTVMYCPKHERLYFFTLKPIYTCECLNINTGRIDFVISGGESNPGPPKQKKSGVDRSTKKSSPAGDGSKPSGKGIGAPKPQQAGAPAKAGGKVQDFKKKITKDLNVYTRSKWYTSAVEKGFKNKPALDKFNAHVAAVQGEIDPSAAPVCENCGSCDILLCDCFITGKGVEIVDDAVAIPNSVASMTWRFTWVERILRMFTMPKFDSTVPINHNIDGFSNTQLGDALLWPELLAYIRLNQNVSYVINGKYDRLAKVTHSKKLANKFLDEHKIPLKDRNNASFVNRIHSTVQKAADQDDDAMILAHQNEQHNLNPWGPLAHVWRNSLKYSILAATMYPLLSSKVGIVLMDLSVQVVHRCITNTAKILVFGSASVLFWPLKKCVQSRHASGLIILSGAGYLYQTVTQRSLCQIAAITYWRL